MMLEKQKRVPYFIHTVIYVGVDMSEMSVELQRHMELLT